MEAEAGGGWLVTLSRMAELQTWADAVRNEGRLSLQNLLKTPVACCVDLNRWERQPLRRCSLRNTGMQEKMRAGIQDPSLGV